VAVVVVKQILVGLAVRRGVQWVHLVAVLLVNNQHLQVTAHRTLEEVVVVLLLVLWVVKVVRVLLFLNINELAQM
jgi:hypothetical protein